MVPRVADGPEHFALIQSLDGEVDLKIPINDSVVNQLRGREFAFFGVDLHEEDGRVQFRGEVSLLPGAKIFLEALDNGEVTKAIMRETRLR